MQNKAGNRCYIILHLLKCAGTSISDSISKSYLKKDAIYLYDQQGLGFSVENRKFINAYIKSLPAKQKGKIRVVIGHGAYYGIHKLLTRECAYVVFLREPLARLISNYAYFKMNNDRKVGTRGSVYERNKLYSITQWAEKSIGMHDYMTRTLFEKLFNKKIKGEVNKDQLKMVIEKLKTFAEVGIVERPVDFLLLYSKMGLPPEIVKSNVTGREFYPGKVNAGELEQYLSKDFALYNYFLNYKIPKRSRMDELKYDLNALTYKLKVL